MVYGHGLRGIPGPQRPSPERFTSAERQGLWLERSRRHDPRASSYGLYALKTWTTRQLVSEPGVRDDHAWTLDEVEQYLMTGSV